MFVVSEDTALLDYQCHCDDGVNRGSAKGWTAVANGAGLKDSCNYWIGFVEELQKQLSIGHSQGLPIVLEFCFLSGHWGRVVLEDVLPTLRRGSEHVYL